MAETIDAKDFVASKGNQTAPLGGLNEFSVDDTAVNNIPKSSDGHQMVCVWGYTQSVGKYGQQGVHLVPAKYFKQPPPGQSEPMTADSFSLQVDPGGDGRVYRDGKMVMLLWTTAENYKRLERNRDEAAKRMAGGAEMFQSRIRGEDRILDQLGIGYWTEDKLVRPSTPDYEPAPIQNPARVQMAGPKL